MGACTVVTRDGYRPSQMAKYKRLYPKVLLIESILDLRLLGDHTEAGRILVQAVHWVVRTVLARLF